MAEEINRRSVSKSEYLEVTGGALVPYFEHLVGGGAELVSFLEPGEMVLVSQLPVKAENGLTVNWVGVGMIREPNGLVVFCLRFDRGETGPAEVGTPLGEFFPGSEPFKYRLTFTLAAVGMHFLAVERLTVDDNVPWWQECDPDTTYLILEALEDVLPRLKQQGE